MDPLAITSKVVNTADYVSISDHLGRYCWNVDNGYADAWADLWTDDGVYTGIFEQPVVGREALKTVPPISFNGSDGGKLRHFIGNLSADYGDTNDIVHAHFYNLVTTWIGSGSFTVMAICEASLVRHGSGWLIKTNNATMLRAAQPAAAEKA